MAKAKKKIFSNIKDPKEVPAINFDELYDKMQDFLEKNKDHYIMIAYSDTDNYFILIQKEKLTTKHINNNNPFQPYEHEQTKDHATCLVVWVSYTRIEPDFVKEIKKFNARVLKLLPMDDFNEKIKKKC